MGFMWEDGQKCHVYNLIFHKDANTESPKLVTKCAKISTNGRRRYE